MAKKPKTAPEEITDDIRAEHDRRKRVVAQRKKDQKFFEKLFQNPEVAAFLKEMADEIEADLHWLPNDTRSKMYESAQVYKAKKRIFERFSTLGSDRAVRGAQREVELFEEKYPLLTRKPEDKGGE